MTLIRTPKSKRRPSPAPCPPPRPRRLPLGRGRERRRRGAEADRRPHPLRRQHAGEARRHPDRHRPDRRRQRTLRPAPGERHRAAALPPERPEPRTAGEPAPATGALDQDLGEGQRGDRRPRHQGGHPRAGPRQRRLRQDPGDRRAGRQAARGQAAGRPRESRDRPLAPRHHQAPAGDGDPRRRPLPLHLPAEQLGRRHRPQGGRRSPQPAGSRRAPASSASPTKSSSPKTRR